MAPGRGRDASREPASSAAPPVVDGAFARWLVGRAAQVLLEVRSEIGFDDPARLLSAAGKLSRDVLLTELARGRPADAVRAEHHPPGGAPRWDADRVWIVDPLDGTREFAEEGRTDWAVQVALWSRRTRRLVAGAVGLPALHRVLATDQPPAYPPLTGPAATGGRLRIATCRGRPPVGLTELAAGLGADLVPFGCTGTRIAGVVCGRVDAYVQFVGQDAGRSAGAVAVANATGLHASRTDGSTLEYGPADPRVPDMLVCRTDLAPELLAALRAARRD
jgi:3'(2'), 5'-bisphosphate nucleotidase